MAIYHLEAQIIGRSDGRSAIACAAYRAGVALTDERTGTVHVHGNPARVAHAEVLAPEGAPAWALDRAALWNRVEVSERRKDSQLAREFEVALPNELGIAEQIELLRGWVAAELHPWGVVVDVAIHRQTDPTKPQQDHAHLMGTTRGIAADLAGFGSKIRELNDRAMLDVWRESWAVHVNAALAGAGHDARIDHRSHADRGLVEEPTRKEGPGARGRVARGQASERVAMNRTIRARNGRIRAQLANIKARIAATIRGKPNAVRSQALPAAAFRSPESPARGAWPFGRAAGGDRVRGLPGRRMGAGRRIDGGDVPEVRQPDVRPVGANEDGLRRTRAGADTGQGLTDHPTPTETLRNAARVRVLATERAKLARGPKPQLPQATPPAADAIDVDQQLAWLAQQERRGR